VSIEIKILIGTLPPPHGLATLPKIIHSLWFIHPDITGLASLSASIHSPGEDTCISHLNFLSPSLSINLAVYKRRGQSICFSHLRDDVFLSRMS